MNELSDPQKQLLCTEYSAAHDAYLHYDKFTWQVGAVLIAGVFILWGFLLQADAREPVFLAVTALVSILMSVWILYADHNRQIYIQKLDRICEIEELLAFEQHRDWSPSQGCVCRTFGPGGYLLDRLAYAAVCAGGPVIGSIRFPGAARLWLPLCVVPFVLTWIAFNNVALNSRRQTRAAKRRGENGGDGAR